MTVSIIVSIYNIVDYLSYCLNSLIYQDYQDLEIILVDDGSKDGSSQLCDEVAKSDSRIKVVHKPESFTKANPHTAIMLKTTESLISSSFCFDNTYMQQIPKELST